MIYVLSFCVILYDTNPSLLNQISCLMKKCQIQFILEASFPSQPMLLMSQYLRHLHTTTKVQPSALSSSHTLHAPSLWGCLTANMTQQLNSPSGYGVTRTLRANLASGLVVESMSTTCAFKEIINHTLMQLLGVVIPYCVNYWSGQMSKVEVYQRLSQRIAWP